MCVCVCSGSHPELPAQQWCHIHSLIVLRLPPWLLCPPPPNLQLWCFCRVSHVAPLKELLSSRTLAGAAVTLWVPTISCPSSWVTAQLAAQYRKLVHKVSGEPVGHCGLCWVPIVFLVGFYWETWCFFCSLICPISEFCNTLVECFDVWTSHTFKIKVSVFQLRNVNCKSQGSIQGFSSLQWICMTVLKVSKCRDR